MENGSEQNFITNLHIQNFKSIRDLEIPCKRVNVLIGEPNTGKSNILEALGVLSAMKYPGNLKSFVRLVDYSDLFHHTDLAKKIRIEADLGNGKKMGCAIQFDGSYQFSPLNGNKPQRLPHLDQQITIEQVQNLSHSVKYYQFAPTATFSPSFHLETLIPPNGLNLPHLLKTNAGLREDIGLFFHQYNLKLVIQSLKNVLEVQKEQDGIAVTYPYTNVSDTLKRMVFYTAAIETSKSDTLCFEEPAAFSFPQYAKELGEKIARDETNQYILATHNPYILANVVEKTSTDDIQVIVVYYDKQNHETRILALDQEEIREIIDMGASAFLNLDMFLETA